MELTMLEPDKPPVEGESNGVEPTRTTYVPPKLMKYGTLGELTQHNPGSKSPDGGFGLYTS